MSTPPETRGSRRWRLPGPRGALAPVFVAPLVAMIAVVAAAASEADDPIAIAVPTSAGDLEPIGDEEGDESFADEPSTPFVGPWLDTAQVAPADPLEIRSVENGLEIDWGGKRARLDVFDTDNAPVESVDSPPRPGTPPNPYAIAVIDDGDSEHHLRVEAHEATLIIEVSTHAKDGSKRPDFRPKAVYARRDDFLPNGYTIFFANDFEAGLVKEGVNFGALVAGPHVVELGNSGQAIFGSIDPKPGLPPHPDHAPGFFVIDSATDTVKTGLDRKQWRAELAALGVTSPRMDAPKRKWPKSF